MRKYLFCKIITTWNVWGNVSWFFHSIAPSSNEHVLALNNYNHLQDGKDCRDIKHFTIFAQCWITNLAFAYVIYFKPLYWYNLLSFEKLQHSLQSSKKNPAQHLSCKIKQTSKTKNSYARRNCWSQNMLQKCKVK